MEQLNKLTTIFEEYLVKKAPVLPANFKELLVKFAPWISILAIILTLPAVLGFIGLSTSLYSSPFGGYLLGQTSITYTLGILFMIVSLVLRGLAVPGLLNRTKSGWNMVYYSVLVSAVYSLLSFDFVGLIVGTLISLYLIFQVKEYYK